MKRLILIMVATLGLTFSLMASAQAAEVLETPCQQTPDAVVCQENNKVQRPEDNSIYGSNGVLTKVTNIFGILTGVVAVIMIIIAGLQYILSTGDPAKTSEAKNMIIFALVGLIVVLIARTIILFVIRVL